MHFSENLGKFWSGAEAMYGVFLGIDFSSFGACYRKPSLRFSEDGRHHVSYRYRNWMGM
jgi:hypothetical protein